LSKFGFFKGNVAVLAISMAIFAFAEQMVFPYLSIYISALGGDAQSIGLVYSLGTIGSVILLPIGGYIADNRGRVKIVAAMSYVFALSSIFFITATNWRLLIIGVFFQRLSLIYTPAMAALMADSLSIQQRGIGFAAFRAIPGLAALSSPYIAGYLIDKYNTIIAMKICYTIFLICGIIASTLRLKLTETLPENRVNLSLSNFPKLLVTSYRNMLDALKEVPKTMWAITAISCISIFFGSIAGPFWVVYAMEVIKLSAKEWGTIILCATGLRIVLSLPAGRIIDTVGKKKCILASLALMPIPILFFIRSKTFMEVLIVVLLIECFDDFLMPSARALVADLIPRHKRGLINAALGRGYLIVTVGGTLGGGALALFIPSMLGFALGGYIYPINNIFPWILLALAMAISALLSALFIQEPEKPEI
jgi:MFS family permease